MSPDDDEITDGNHPGQGEFVPAVIARTLDEAEALREFLEDHDIPVLLGRQPVEGNAKGRGSAAARGVAVLVPEELLDEASEIIAECDEMDEYEADEDEDLEEDDEEDDEEEDAEGLELEEEELDEEEDDEEEDEEEEDEEEDDDEEFLLDDDVGDEDEADEDEEEGEAV